MFGADHERRWSSVAAATVRPIGATASDVLLAGDRITYGARYRKCLALTVGPRDSGQRSGPPGGSTVAACTSERVGDMPRWEYLTVRLYEHAGWRSWVDSRGREGRLDLVAQGSLAGDSYFPVVLLTALGEGSWELVSATPAGKYATTLFFKRPQAS